MSQSEIDDDGFDESPDPHWFCESCGKRHDWAMPADRHKFYKNPKARICRPGCRSEAVMPRGW